MKRLILCLLLSLTLILTGCSNKGANTGDDASQVAQSGKYENADVSFSYPTSWSMRESDTPIGRVIILYAPDNEDGVQPNLNVIIQDLSGQPNVPDLEKYTEVSKNSLNEIVEGLTILNEKSTEIDGEEAFEITYRGGTKSNPGKPFQWWQAWTVEDDQAYIMTLTASPESFEKYQSAAAEVLESFDIK